LKKASEIQRKSRLSQVLHMMLALALMIGWIPAVPQAVRATAGTPGGVDEAALRLWLKADTGSVTLSGSDVTQWRDSSGKGNHFVNDGSIAAISARPKPKYVSSNIGLNYQPTIQFVRSGSSILQDANGLFGDGESVNDASVFTVAGGVPTIENTQLFDESLTSGNFGASLPHKLNSNTADGFGTVIWDAGILTSGSGFPRVTATNQVTKSLYNMWGLHFDANPTVESAVYQSIYRDGQTVLDSTAPRLPFIGKADGPMSIGSAAGGGSGYNGQMGEMIVFTAPLTPTQRRQVETYLAIKFGTSLTEGNYLSAGSSPLVVWDAAVNAAYNNNVAGVALDQVGALAQAQSKSSSPGVPQVVIRAANSLTDKQYLLWGDNGSTEPAVPYGSGFMKLARTWKVQNTGNTGTVQVAIPVSVIPLGGVLLQSNDNGFVSSTQVPLSPTQIGGVDYYAAEATLTDGSYFTFAEKLPEVQLTSLELWDAAQQVAMNTAFLPSKTSGYEAVVAEAVDNIRVMAQAEAGTHINIILNNYVNTNLVIADPTQLPLVPGVNKLTIELSKGDSINAYHVDVVRKLSKGANGKIELNAGTVTASSYQPNTTNIPTNVVDGIWDTDVRWSASGQGQWLQFDLGRPETVTYMQIAFLNAHERLSNFEILGSNDAEFTTSVVLLPQRKSRILQLTDQLLQPYVLKNPASLRYLRIVGYGNTAEGSSGNWNSITETELYTGTPPVIVEPEEPSGPPQAGDKPVEAVPPMTVVKVSTANQLQAALDQVVQGTVIELQSGIYEQNGPFVIKNKQGSSALPIRITAAELGKAIITGNSYMHVENSKHIEVSGLTFRNGIGGAGGEQTLLDRGWNAEDEFIKTRAGVHPGVELYNSSNVSILRNTFALDETGQPYRFSTPDGQVWCLTGIEGSCRIGGGDSYNPDSPVYSGPTPHTDSSLITDNGTHRHYIRVEGISSHNRIAYNEIGPKKGFGAVVTYNGEAGHNISQNDVIEYNYFHSLGPRVTNGMEAIRLGLSGLSLKSGHVTIQHNLFDGLNAEDEIISVKSSDNIIRYNTLRNSFGGIVARHGHRNSFYGNFIIGDGKKAGMGGFRIYGNDHKIYNNYMEGLTDRGIELDGGSHDGGPDGGSNPTVTWKEGSTEQSAVLNTLSSEKQTEILRGHWRQYNVQIFNNTLVNIGGKTNSFYIGGRTYQPVGSKITNNLVFSNAGTIFHETNLITDASRPTYAGNQVDGVAAISANATVIGATYKGDLRLIRSTDGLIRLSGYSPAIDASQGTYYLADDMDGQTRYTTPDVGADEYSAGVTPTQRPLTTLDVGPQAGRNIPIEEDEPNLSSLMLQPSLLLSPEFNSNTTFYKVMIPSGSGSVKLIPTALATGSQIRMSIDGKADQLLLSGQESQTLTIAANGSVIRVEVKLPSGKSKTYTIFAEREREIHYSSPDTPAPAPVPVPVPTPVPMPTPAPIPAQPEPTTPSPSEQVVEFVDAKSHWAGEVITEAVKKGIVNGYPDGSFKPEEPMTRLHFAALIVRALGLSGVGEGVTFTDEADIPEWATGEVSAAIEAGILNGYEDHSLRPNQSINRAEMVTMLLRAYKQNTKFSDAPFFSDTSLIPEWAQSSVNEAAALGLIEGRDNNEFAPNETATRAEAVMVLMRMLEQ
jgi:hypothetical protein